MNIKTYRAKTMRDALELVRRELGPSAAVLHTREVNSGPLRRLVFGRKYEVAASATVNVPSRLPETFAEPAEEYSFHSPVAAHDRGITPAEADVDYRARYRDDFRRQVAGQLDELHAMVEKLCDQAASAPAHDLPAALFDVFTNLIEAEVDEAIAREWVERLRASGVSRMLEDSSLLMGRVA